MTYEEFDQTMGAGWRALAKQGDFAGAARALEEYLAAHRDHLEDWQVRTLHHHAAQMHAYSGSDAGSYARALAHLPFARIPDEPADSFFRWNAYVDATEAFLRGDRAAFDAARAYIAAGPADEKGWIPNLAVVDRLAANFGKPYSEAY